jgi:hypothetical protein
MLSPHRREDPVPLAQKGPAVRFSEPPPAPKPAKKDEDDDDDEDEEAGLMVQSLANLDLGLLSPLTPEVISRQATINVGTIGHVAHGKSTVVRAISGVKTVSAATKSRLEAAAPARPQRRRPAPASRAALARRASRR